jgi:hypothetical protein
MRRTAVPITTVAIWFAVICVAAGPASQYPAIADASATPTASPNPTPSSTATATPEPPRVLTLSAGVGLSPAGGTTSFALVPIPGSSPPMQRIGYGDSNTNPALSLILLANYPFFTAPSQGWLRALGTPNGTIGIGTNKTDLIAGLSWGSGQSDQVKNFLTLGVRQISVPAFQNGFGIGTVVPNSFNLTSATYTRHVTRFFIGYTVDASALVCLLPHIAIPVSGCANDKGSSATPAPTTSPSPSHT